MTCGTASHNKTLTSINIQLNLSTIWIINLSKFQIDIKKKNQYGMRIFPITAFLYC